MFRFLTALGSLGLASDVFEFGSGTASIGSNFRYYTDFYGNQYVSVTMFSDIAKTTGLGFAGLGVAADFGGALNGNISWTKFGVDTGVTGAGLWIGGVPGAVITGSYFLIDKTYPGGIRAAMEQEIDYFLDPIGTMYPDNSNP